ncbi:MAG: LytTR family transcriptional regulator DNA-binding domain-containing protein [Lachnospiraceae bacterium]|nr:LytTR family transcriptional regulator DNA-binding domain-containing protein [Lachnospiraceae bacterium]
MTDMGVKSIRLMVNRKERIVPVDSIIYAQVTDKLCTIFREDTSPIQIFMTIASLKAMLPPRRFVQINRNCLISLNHLQDLDESCVIMSNGTHLPYSRRQKQVILSAMQDRLTGLSHRQDAVTWKQNLADEFRCFDHFPLPFCIVETEFDSVESTQRCMIRYANEAFASLMRRPLHYLLDVPFAAAFPFLNSQWQQLFTQCALDNQRFERTLPHMQTGESVRVLCYQPHYGFCGCLFFDTKES